MLSARLLIYETRLLLGRRRPDLQGAKSLLEEAEGSLIGRRLAELEALVRELRRKLRDASPAVRRVVPPGAAAHRVRSAASSSLPILITGETGAGKDLVARAIHGESARRAGPFVAVNCAALPEELLEAELFGCRKGAFTGAEEDQPGLLASAHGGTFFFASSTPAGRVRWAARRRWKSTRVSSSRRTGTS